jgi:hypothetical protein
MKSYAQVMGIPRTEEYIGTGDAAIYNTVDKMKSIIAQSSKNPYVREWAGTILSGIEVNNKAQEAESIYNFVRDNIRYTKDPLGYEYIQTPLVLLESIGQYQNRKGVRPSGDCDDMTVLSLSLLKSVGFNVAIKVVSFKEDKKFGHVYGLVQIGYDWVPFDCVRPDAVMGWESSGHTRVMETII